MKQVVVVFHLREGSELEAERLAASEPPFDPKRAGFKRLAVYLTHREAVFVLEGEEPEWSADALIDDFLQPALRDRLDEAGRRTDLARTPGLLLGGVSR